MKQVSRLDKIGRKVVESVINEINDYPLLSTRVDLVLKAGEIIKLLQWLEENTSFDR